MSTPYPALPTLPPARPRRSPPVPVTHSHKYFCSSLTLSSNYYLTTAFRSGDIPLRNVTIYNSIPLNTYSGNYDK